MAAAIRMMAETQYDTHGGYAHGGSVHGGSVHGVYTYGMVAEKQSDWR